MPKTKSDAPETGSIRDRLCELKRAYCKATGVRPTHINLSHDDAWLLDPPDLLGHVPLLSESVLGMEIATVGDYDKTRVYAGLVELEVFRGILTPVNIPPGITLRVHDFDVLEVTGTRRRGQHCDREEPCMTTDHQGPVGDLGPV